MSASIYYKKNFKHLALRKFRDGDNVNELKDINIQHRSNKETNAKTGKKKDSHILILKLHEFQTWFPTTLQNRVDVK